MCVYIYVCVCIDMSRVGRLSSIEQPPWLLGSRLVNLPLKGTPQDACQQPHRFHAVLLKQRTQRSADGHFGAILG